MDANTDRTKVSENLHMGGISIPDFDVEEEKEYQTFDEIIGLVEIVSKKEIEFIEYPWDNFNNCHHEEEGLKNVVDQKGMSLGNVFKKVKFYLIKNVLPEFHFNNDLKADMGVKFLLQFIN